MKKPIIRWVIGPVSDEGFACLRTAVQHMTRIYRSRCRYIICHNKLSTRQKALLPNVELVDQAKFVDALPYDPPSTEGLPAWKLYPPRLDQDAHEIIIDNDIVIYNEPALFAQFLAGDNMVVATQAPKRSYTDKFQVPEGFNMNSGIICLPPRFDYAGLLTKRLLASPGKWQHHLDEQTLVASIFCGLDNLRLIPLDDIYVCLKYYRKGVSGVHFVLLNNGMTKFWDQYVSEEVKLL